MHMTRKEASKILNVPDGASKEEIKQMYAKIALTTHPDQKSSTPETTKMFEKVSMAYKRLQQPAHKNYVELSHLMEQFSTVFRFRMKTENGYVYFMYNPFTGLPESDSDDCPDDDHDKRRDNGFNNLLFSYSRKSKALHKMNNHKKIVDVDPVKFKEMQANANKNAEELINEEDKAKDKAKKRREKRQRQKEKKRQTKKISTDLDSAFSDNCVRSSGNSYDAKGDRKSNPDLESSGSNKTDSRSYPDKATNILFNNLSDDVISNANARQNSVLSHYDKKTKSIANAFMHLNDYGSQNSLSSDSENENENDDQFDEESAFFANAIKSVGVNQRKGTQQALIKNESTSFQNESIPAPSQDQARDIIALSRQLAMQGNQLASNKNYEEAAKLFTKAINLFNTDCRYFGNRSYCYDRMERYEKALEDADRAISLSSHWAKGYFRRGRALAGLERYVEAEQAYEEVLKLDRQCSDAEQELKNVRLKHLMDMGFSKEQCEAALKKRKTISLALEELLGNALDASNITDANNHNGASDDENSFIQTKFKRKAPTPSPAPPAPAPQSTQLQQEIPDETFSQVDYNSLWIGNITVRVTRDALWTYFSQFGDISDVTIMYERRCAFVNFKTTDSSRAALLKSDTLEICGELLVVRYPDRAFLQAPARISYKSKRECFYWRNRGCHFGSACRYLHVEANKGIDLQTVERTPYQSTVQY